MTIVILAFLSHNMGNPLCLMQYNYNVNTTLPISL